MSQHVYPEYVRMGYSFRMVVGALAGLLFGWSGTAQWGAAQTYTIRSLGVQLGHSSSIASSINDKGFITGLTSNLNEDESRGFVIGPPYEQMTAIGTLDDLPVSIGDAINNHGVVAARNYDINLDTKLMVWNSGTLTRVSDPAGTDLGFKFNTEINEAGLIVGTANNIGFLYINGDSIALNPLAGDSFSSANSINEASIVVGTSSIGLNEPRAVKWIQGLPQPLPTLGGVKSSAFDIADNGLIVGASDDTTGTQLAYMILPNNTPVSLGTLPGTMNSRANATNGTAIVGDTSLGNPILNCFIYQNGQMKSLNDLIPPDSGWFLQHATDINAHGQICGFGNFNGTRRAFIMTPNDGSGGAADWDLTVGEQGWTAITNIPPFEPAEAEWVEGTGFGLRATGFPCFAFLQSPEMTLQPGRTYRLFCTVSNTAAAADAAPQLRLRAIQTTTSMSELLSLDSTAGAIPSNTSRRYEYTITTQINGPAQTYRFNLDYTYFNPFDDQMAWVYLESVLLVED